MPKSLKMMFRSMYHNGIIDEKTYAALVKKLEGHDRELLAKGNRRKGELT